MYYKYLLQTREITIIREYERNILFILVKIFHWALIVKISFNIANHTRWLKWMWPNFDATASQSNHLLIRKLWRIPFILSVKTKIFVLPCWKNQILIPNFDNSKDLIAKQHFKWDKISSLRRFSQEDMKSWFFEHYFAKFEFVLSRSRKNNRL